MANKHSITLEQATAMTKFYRAEKDNIVNPESINLLPISETFDKTAFQELLAVPGVVSIRCYLGMDTDKLVRMIFVAVNAADEDILPPAGQIMENGEHCPPICAPSGLLNS